MIFDLLQKIFICKRIFILSWLIYPFVIDGSVSRFHFFSCFWVSPLESKRYPRKRLGLLLSYLSDVSELSKEPQDSYSSDHLVWGQSFILEVSDTVSWFVLVGKVHDHWVKLHYVRRVFWLDLDPNVNRVWRSQGSPDCLRLFNRDFLMKIKSGITSCVLVSIDPYIAQYSGSDVWSY